MQASPSTITLDPRYLDAWDLLHGQVGVVKDIFRMRIHGTCPRSFLYTGRISEPRELFPQRLLMNASSSVAGMNIDQRLAMWGCLFEGIERYCSAVPGGAPMVWASEAELRERSMACVSHRDFDLFHEVAYLAEGFPFNPWHANTRLRWTEFTSLPDGTPALVPAQFAYVPYAFVRHEARLFDSFSSGSACHGSYDQAVYSAICEVVERDALMVWWHNRLPVPNIMVDSLAGHDAVIDEILSRIDAIPGLQLLVKDITTDIQMPTLLTILKNAGNPSAAALAFSAATALQPVDALRKALNELIGTYAYAHRLHFEDEKFAHVEANPGMWHRIISLDEHVALYADHAILEYLDWLTGGVCMTLDDVVMHYAETTVCRDGDEDLTNAIRCLDGAGLRVYAKDITLPEIGDAGFTVARAYVPGAVPLHSAHAFRPMGCRRLANVPVALGYERSAVPNPLPHPYP